MLSMAVQTKLHFGEQKQKSPTIDILEDILPLISRFHENIKRLHVFPMLTQAASQLKPEAFEVIFLGESSKIEALWSFPIQLFHGVPHHFGSRLEGCWETSHWVDMVKLNKGYVYWKQWNSDIFSKVTGWQVYCGLSQSPFFIRCSYPSMNQSTRVGSLSAQPWSGHHFCRRHWSHWRPNHRRTTATQTTANQ